MNSSANDGDGEEEEDDGIENEEHSVFNHCFSELPKAPLRGQPVIQKATAFEDVRDRFSSSSKPSKQRLSSKENPIKKQKTLNWIVASLRGQPVIKKAIAFEKTRDCPSSSSSSKPSKRRPSSKRNPIKKPNN